MAKNPSVSTDMPTINIPVNWIFVDYEFNVRKTGEKDNYTGVDELAKQVKAEGQLSPVLVRQLTEEEIEELEDESMKYKLIFGFRRYDAIAHVLEWDTIRAQVTTGDPANDEFINLAENVARENLKPHELAERFSRMKAEREMSGTQIANRLGMSRGHVNNLIKIWDESHITIRDAFATEHPKATTDALRRIVQSKDKDIQLEKWYDHIGFRPEEDEEGDEGDGEAAASEPEKLKRPSMKKLKEAIEMVDMLLKSGDSKKSKAELKAMKVALRWAAAETKTISGVYDPKKGLPSDDSDAK